MISPGLRISDCYTPGFQTHLSYEPNYFNDLAATSLQ